MLFPRSWEPAEVSLNSKNSRSIFVFTIHDTLNQNPSAYTKKDKPNKNLIPASRAPTEYDTLGSYAPGGASNEIVAVTG